jgi:hypothetical protein
MVTSAASAAAGSSFRSIELLLDTSGAATALETLPDGARGRLLAHDVGASAAARLLDLPPNRLEAARQRPRSRARQIGKDIEQVAHAEILAEKAPR